MKDRLRLIINDKAGGSQRQFASLMGWTPQYIHILLRDGSIGINPITAILTMFPDIDARWLILGEGDMYRTRQIADDFMRFDHYVSVMTDEELELFAHGNLIIDLPTINKWKALLDHKQQHIYNVFARAYERQQS